MRKFAKFALILVLVLALGGGMAACAHDGGGPVASIGETVDQTYMEKVITQPTFSAGEPEESAAITPDYPFMDGMVLQRRAVNRLTGKTSAAHIAVEVLGAQYFGSVTGGEFEVYLPPFEAGGPYTLTLFDKDNQRTLRDVYVGEVFLLSGQSNMVWSVGESAAGTKTAAEALPAAPIRLLRLPRRDSALPERSASAVWQVPSAGGIAEFSAVGYLFGLQLAEALRVPVGLVQAAVGGSPLSYWLPKEKMEALSARQRVMTRDTRPPSAGYNGMIHPVKGLRYRGVLWYQGETNAGMATTYHGELSALIKDYREVLGDARLTFIVIGLPRYESGNADGWARIREAQAAVAKELPHVAYSVNIDLGDYFDIHPSDKTVIARRSAEAALKKFFGQAGQPLPTLQKAERLSDGSVKLTLEGAEGLYLKNGANGFEYSANGYAFEEVTDVTVQGNTLIVTAQEKIDVLRYGFRTYFSDKAVREDVSRHVTVYNAAGNPLDQFEVSFP